MADRKKRSRNANRSEKQSDSHKEEEPVDVDESSPVIQFFRSFQQELDKKHDRHERIVKLSRDITIESKRIIFTLHRVKDADNSDDLLAQTETRLLDLENTKFRQVAQELANELPYQFLRAYTAGLQEYIEALTFHFYLKENKLIPLQRVQDRLVFKQETNDSMTETSNNQTKTSNNQTNVATDGENTDNQCQSSCSGENETISVLVPPSEYILGIADLTGEMMRRAINSVADGDLNRPFEICTFLQEIELAFSGLTNCNREVNRKLTVLRQSLRKVEAACYTLKVRGSEIPKHMLVDVISKTSSAAQFIDDLIVEED